MSDCRRPDCQPAARRKKVELRSTRIISGKFTNCGQVCLAPDYIYVHREILNPLINEFKKQIELQYGKNPKENPGYSRLIHEAHVNRTESLLKGHEEKIIAKYGEIDAKNRFFPPTLLLEPDLNSTLMKEEIFGPILPIFPYDSPLEVIKFINNGSRPLAVYYYGQPDSIVRQRIEENTTSGSFVVNDSIVQFAIATLPFGGIGDSGYGVTHGEHGRRE